MSTKNDLVIEIAARAGLEQQAVRRVVQLTLESIVEALVMEGRLELRNFGVFEVRVRKGKVGRNPRTGQAVRVPARRMVKFKVGRIMRARVLGMDGDGR